MKKLDKPNKLEREIINWFSNTNPIISEQINKASISKREYSGAGFFIYFQIPKNTLPITDNNLKNKQLSGPYIKSKELEFGGGSILFIKNGFINLLEIFSYSDSFPEDLSLFELENNKNEILRNLCYTKLVYNRINKKLNTNFSKKQIEDFILRALKNTEEKFYVKIGKNYYITNIKNNIRITIKLTTSQQADEV